MYMCLLVKVKILVESARRVSPELYLEKACVYTGLTSYDQLSVLLR